MNSELLSRLMAADPAERQWLLLESVLESLSAEVRQAVWTIAVPHWFDDRILAALCPELAAQASEIYQELQALSFVEVFEGRGHNIYEATRSILLDRLWHDRSDEFKLISARSAEYFEHDAENVAEWLYHKAVRESIADELDDVMQSLNHQFRRSESEVILKALNEQIVAGRVKSNVAAAVAYWQGELHRRFYESDSVLTLTKSWTARYFSNFNLLKLTFQVLSSIGISFVVITLIYMFNKAHSLLLIGLISAEIVNLIIVISLVIMTLSFVYTIYRNSKNRPSDALPQRQYGPSIAASKIIVKVLFLGLMGLTISISLFAVLGQSSSVVLLSQIWQGVWKPIATLILMTVILEAIEESYSPPQDRSITRSILEAVKGVINTRNR